MRGPRKFARVPLERRRNKKKKREGGEGREKRRKRGRTGSRKREKEGGETEGMPFHREIVTDSRR